MNQLCVYPQINPLCTRASVILRHRSKIASGKHLLPKMVFGCSQSLHMSVLSSSPKHCTADIHPKISQVLAGHVNRAQYSWKHFFLRQHHPMAERWKSSRGLFKCGGNSKHANLLNNAPRGHVPSPPRLALHSSAPGEVL